MRSLATLLFALAAIASAPAAHAALSVFACEPEWAALAKEVGGDKLSIFSAVTPHQDPHRIEARPSLIARVRSADMVVCTGAELEVGWLPLLLRSAGNARILTGQPASFMASDYVTRLDVPARLDRSEGDVHPYGNPHVHLDPRNLSRIAKALGERLARVDPANATVYQSRSAEFIARLEQAIPQWEARAAPLKGMRIVTQHKDSDYLLRWLGVLEAGALEPKPGVQPSAAYLGELLEKVKKDPVSGIVRSAYHDPKPSEWLSGRAGLPVAVLPYTVGGDAQAVDLFALFDDSIAQLLKLRKPA
jgi:zinc/manganese transport system substrate-binding protein